MPFLTSRSGVFMLSFFSGILLSLAWPATGFAPLLFVAFVPLLFAEDILSKKVSGSKALVFINSYFTFFTFNLLTTWWVKYASFFGAVAAIFFNALFMAIVFHLFHVTKKKLGSSAGYISLVVYWVTFEHLHMDWDLSWPWLTLGNGFAGWIKMIQWYEFTGVLGGTIWIWVLNILIFKIFSAAFVQQNFNNHKREFVAAILLMLIPISWSFYRYYSYEEIKDPVNVAVIQPNIDPYHEKFSGMSSGDQLKRIIQLASDVVDSNTNYVVAPETSLPDGIWEDQLGEHPHIMLLKEFRNNFPKLHWVIGAATNEFYPDSNLRSATSRKFTQADGYYDSYNTALHIENNEKIQLHHKSKLVPGVEKMPFPQLFKHIDKFAIDLGGISGSLGMQDVPSVFKNEADKTIVAPVICYESIYGDYLSEYVRQGANIIFIITNDGWWSDTPGYRQHLKYATLRAIELRRSIARSANTGISCFINQRGDILQPTKWWVPDSISATLNSNDRLTFYARFGDYIGTICKILCLVFVFGIVMKRKTIVIK